MLFAAVLVYVTLIADQVSEAQPESYTNEESKICKDPAHSFSYDADGERHFVPYEVIDGQVVVEGDIQVGSAEELLRQGANYAPPVVPDYIDGQRTRWGNGVAPYVVPFVIDGSAEAYRSLIRDAMMAWSDETNIRFVERKERMDWQKENYVKFISGPTDRTRWVCTSNSIGVKEKVGAGEEGNINVVRVAGCGSWGGIAHEIGHVLGLGHEQSRIDRDQYITMLWGNIKKGKDIDYCKVIWNQQTLANTPYDYDSIMHYPVDGFAKDESDPSCQKVLYNNKQRCLAFIPDQEKLRRQEQEIGRRITIGQTDHLSKLDIETIRTLYPGPPPREPPAPVNTQPCTMTITTVVQIGDRISRTEKIEPCGTTESSSPWPPAPIRRPRWPVCHPDTCHPARVSWPRHDRWCCPGCCRPHPRLRRPICDPWEPPFDDWDD